MKVDGFCVEEREPDTQENVLDDPIHIKVKKQAREFYGGGSDRGWGQEGTLGLGSCCFLTPGAGYLSAQLLETHSAAQSRCAATPCHTERDIEGPFL